VIVDEAQCRIALRALAVSGLRDRQAEATFVGPDLLLDGRAQGNSALATVVTDTPAPVRAHNRFTISETAFVGVHIEYGTVVM
jgi:hypothetical protein